MAESSASFTIVHRDRHGEPDFVYPWDGNLATCVVASINICRGMLRNAKIRSAFVSFTREYNRSNPRAWYQDPRYGYETTEDVVVTFINVILASFPIVYIDESITSPGTLGGHPRRAWDHHFQPRDQSILLNGWRVRDMVAAATRAHRTNDPSDNENKRFRTFIFLFANTFLHEIGHTLVTFLTKGRTSTPRHIRATIRGYSADGRGEAGRNLEEIIFGGTMEFYRDRADDDSQPGIPHTFTREGVRRISQESIDDTVRYYFHSPYHLEGRLRNSCEMEPLGHNYPQPVLTDPMEWIIMDTFKKLPECQKESLVWRKEDPEGRGRETGRFLGLSFSRACENLWENFSGSPNN
ncbi:MAG: hypothetical protein ASARMPREDX12_007396 [Alectoria sarmentosa]|nr:MAG: hypothetical protein ASARMPREDX12_007396 [Alectoria sarmentosa]